METLDFDLDGLIRVHQVSVLESLDAAGLKAALKLLMETMGKLQEKVDKIPEDTSAKVPQDLQDQLDALRRDVDDGKARQDELAAAAAQASEDAKAADERARAAEARAAAAEDSVKDLSDRVASLEAQLPEVKKEAGEAGLLAADALAKGTRADERNGAQDAELAAIRGAIDSLAKGEKPAALPPPPPPAPTIDLGPIERRLEKLAGDTADLDNLRNRLKDLEAQLAAQGRRLSDMASPGASPGDLEALARQVQENKDEIAKKASQFDLDKLKNRLAELEGKVGDANMDDLLKRIADLEKNKADKSDMDNALAALSQQSSHHEPITIAVPTGDGGASAQQVADIANAVNSQAGRLKTLEGLVAVLQGRVDSKAANSDLDAVKAELKRLRDQLEKAERELGDKIGKLAGDLGGLENKMGGVGQAIQALAQKSRKFEDDVLRLDAMDRQAAAQLDDLEGRKADRSELGDLAPREAGDAPAPVVSAVPPGLGQKMSHLEKEVSDIKHHVLTVAYGLLLTSVGDKANRILPNFKHEASAQTGKQDSLGMAVDTALDAAKESAGMGGGAGAGGRPLHSDSGAIPPGPVSAGAPRAVGAPKPTGAPVFGMGDPSGRGTGSGESLPLQSQSAAQARQASGAGDEDAEVAGLTSGPGSQNLVSPSPSFALPKGQSGGLGLGSGQGQAGGAAAGSSGAGAAGGAAPEKQAAVFAQSQTEETIIGPGFAQGKKVGPISAPASGPAIASKPALPPRAATPVDALRDMIGRGEVHEKCDKDAMKKLAKFLDDNVLFKSVPGTPGDMTPVVGPGDNKGLFDLVRRLQQEIEKLKKRIGQGGLTTLTSKVPDGDYAMLSSKPLFGYRCMSCDRPLDKLEAQPGYYVPNELFPARLVDSRATSPTKSPPRSGYNSPGPSARQPRPMSETPDLSQLRRPISGPEGRDKLKNMTPQKGWFTESHGPPLLERPTDAGPHLPPGGWRGQGDHGSSRSLVLGSTSRNQLLQPIAGPSPVPGVTPTAPPPGPVETVPEGHEGDDDHVPSLPPIGKGPV